MYSLFFMCMALGCNSDGWVLFYLTTGPIIFVYLVYVAANDGEPCLAIGLTVQGLCIMLACCALRIRRRVSRRRRAEAGTDGTDGSGAGTMTGDDMTPAEMLATGFAGLASARGGGATSRSGAGDGCAATPRDAAGYALPSYRAGYEMQPSPRQWADNGGGGVTDRGGAQQQYVYGASGRTAFGPASHRSIGADPSQAPYQAYGLDPQQQLATYRMQMEQIQQQMVHQQVQAQIQAQVQMQMAQETYRMQAQAQEAYRMQAQAQETYRMQAALAAQVDDPQLAQQQQYHHQQQKQQLAIQQQHLAMAQAQARHRAAADSAAGGGSANPLSPGQVGLSLDGIASGGGTPSGGGVQPQKQSPMGEMESMWMEYAATPSDHLPPSSPEKAEGKGDTGLYV